MCLHGCSPFHDCLSSSVSLSLSLSLSLSSLSSRYIKGKTPSIVPNDPRTSPGPDRSTQGRRRGQEVIDHHGHTEVTGRKVKETSLSTVGTAGSLEITDWKMLNSLAGNSVWKGEGGWVREEGGRVREEG